MKCNKCNAEWQVDATRSASIKICPFCQERLETEKTGGWKFFDNTKDLLAYIASEYGNDALLARKYFSDHTAPLMPQGQKNLVKQAFDCGAVKILQDNMSANQQRKEIAVKQAVGKLTDLMFAQEATEQVIWEFTNALGWSLSSPLAEEWYQKGEDYYKANNGVTQDYTEAAKWYLKAAEQGHAKAQLALSSLYYKGHGVPKDDVKNLIWLTKAVEQGLAEATQDLGVCYRDGLGVPLDYEKAMELFHKAIEQGHIRSYGSLARMFENGRGTPVNYEKALELYNKGAELGDAFAQSNLGYAYKYGSLGIPVNDLEGTKWYQKAIEGYLREATEKDRRAYFSLGQMYEYGRGVTIDIAKALEWYRKADDQGYTPAKEAIERLLKSP